MRFKGQDVWVKTDEGGRPLLDSGGRAEMKYRREDDRSYRPSPDNLQPPGPGDAAAATAPARARRRPAAAASPRAAAGPEVIHIWTDGACTGNPGPMGIGCGRPATAERRERREFLGTGTNNIAELTAIERALAARRARPRSPIRVYSDSPYAIGVVTKGCKAKANQELVARLRG